MRQTCARNPIEAWHKSRGRVKKKFSRLRSGAEGWREKKGKKKEEEVERGERGEGGEETAERRVFFGPAGFRPAELLERKKRP